MARGASSRRQRDIDRVRSRSKLRRRTANRSPRQAILIVCEGSQTEPIYFRGLAKRLRIPNSLLTVTTPDRNDPIGVVEAVIALRSERLTDSKRTETVAYDQAWCVIDVERYGARMRLADALQRAADAGISVALSNPCFEYWILLHFQRTGAPFEDCDRVIHELHAHLPGYAKGSDETDRLFPRVRIAIENAISVEQTQGQYEDDILARNPATSVYSLAQILLPE